MASVAIGLVLALPLAWIARSYAPPAVRFIAYGVVGAFAALAFLHMAAILSRALDRLERAVSEAGGGCGCNGSRGRRN